MPGSERSSVPGSASEVGKTGPRPSAELVVRTYDEHMPTGIAVEQRIAAAVGVVNVAEAALVRVLETELADDEWKRLVGEFLLT